MGAAHHPTSVRWTPAELTALREASEARGVSVTVLVREAVRAALGLPLIDAHLEGDPEAGTVSTADQPRA